MQNYENKKKALFECLANAEKDIKGTILDQTAIAKTFLKRSAPCAPDEILEADRNLSKLRGKESIFKKPDLPITKCLKPKVMPDHQVNPHKWKKYSLSDVDISDHTNTSAAFAFLQEIEIQKDQNSEIQTAETGDDGRITFNKATKIKRSLRSAECDDDEDKPKLKGSKLVMPEYVIGQKIDKNRTKKRQTKSEQSGKSRQLCLSHLDEEDEGAE